MVLTALVLGYVAWASEQPTTQVRTSNPQLLADVLVRPDADGTMQVGFTLNEPARVAVSLVASDHSQEPGASYEVALGLAQPAPAGETDQESLRPLAPEPLRRAVTTLGESDPVFEQVLFRVGTYLVEVRATSKQPVAPSKQPVAPSKQPVAPSKQPVAPSKQPGRLHIRVRATPERARRDSHSQ